MYSQFPQSNQTSSTTNVGPLTDITNVSGSSRRRGRPRLSDRVVRLDNAEVTQPLKLSPQHILPQSPLNSRFNGNRTLTPSTTIPSRTTLSPLKLSVVANTHVTSPPVRHPHGLPPLHPNVVLARRDVRPYQTPRVMLSSVIVVDTDGNPIHHYSITYRKMREYCDSGDATYTCSHYQAKYWYSERTVRHSSKSNPKFSTCCNEGKVQLPFVHDAPQIL
ncbi:hypothetical protein CTI12_AA528170 [Artemisia annua]|uniref:Uncharacterized protein n=1 Tax=Artemisia annua TaxID=35608 RepID=A0A2U1L5H2_ARTAN|nr:hypothetical protein CTI12_AA528170 [Artemisia annua]